MWLWSCRLQVSSPWLKLVQQQVPNKKCIMTSGRCCSPTNVVCQAVSCLICCATAATATLLPAVVPCHLNITGPEAWLSPCHNDGLVPIADHRCCTKRCFVEDQWYEATSHADWDANHWITNLCHMPAHSTAHNELQYATAKQQAARFVMNASTVLL